VGPPPPPSFRPFFFSNSSFLDQIAHYLPTYLPIYLSTSLYLQSTHERANKSKSKQEMDDTIYSTSTQHRLFTFTPKQLSDLRYSTNKAAAEKITESIKRRATAAGIAESEIEEIDCPTAEEELKLVAYYCVKCMQLSDHFQFPSNVKVYPLSPLLSYPLPRYQNSLT